MKKLVFSAAVLALAAIGAFKATSTNDYAFNELQMGNIEMLAQGEDPGDNKKCICDGYTRCRWVKLPTNYQGCPSLHCSHW